MKLNSISMRRWACLGALQCSVFVLFHFWLSCLWMAVWLWTGLMLCQKNTAKYTHKTGPLREGARAFLVYTVYAASAAFMRHLVSDLVIQPFLFYPALWSVPLLSQLFADRFYNSLLPPALCMKIGGILLSVLLLLF